MPISAALTASLDAIGVVMADAQDPWWIVASAAVALHGADPGHVADVDVLLSARDAMWILPTLGIEPRRGSDHPDFRSGILGVWMEPPLPVELMADFYHRSESSWLRVQPRTRQIVVLGATTVYIPEREDLERLLVDLGRPKDIERARKLARLG